MTGKLARALGHAASLICLPCTAATILFEITPSSQTASTGTSFMFTGTITNTSAADVYLNGDVLSFPFPDFITDDSAFLSNAPEILHPNTPYSGELFQVLTGSAAALQTYSGTFTIQGGVNSAAFDTLATTGFNLILARDATVTPGPDTAALCLLALTAIFRGSVFRRASLRR